ncbi:hypothetical protein MVES1_003204a [Malassezia vespertilionis]|nr:uncharacterized protein MVES1_003204a [Malassezia vespertilionis]WFD07835.1 hypothetical protein MVES1_003204a [Malassezia vespertilionis]
MDSCQEIFNAKAISSVPQDNHASEDNNTPVNQELDYMGGPNPIYYCVIA